MAVTFKRQDDLEKMLEEFASFEKLEEIEFPDQKSKKNTLQKSATDESL
ncbi:SPJ_0845 family protein [Streptococcus suis]|nr:SPJ_0845 family protein [Streptococcus suis]